MAVKSHSNWPLQGPIRTDRELDQRKSRRRLVPPAQLRDKKNGLRDLTTAFTSREVCGEQRRRPAQPRFILVRTQGFVPLAKRTTSPSDDTECRGDDTYAYIGAC